MPVLELNNPKSSNPLLDTLEEQIILAGRDTQSFKKLIRDKNFNPEAYQKYFLNSEKNWRFIQSIDKFQLQAGDDDWTISRKKEALRREIQNLESTRFKTDLLELFKATNQEEVNSSIAWRNVGAETVSGAAPIIGTVIGGISGGPIGAGLGGSAGTVIGKASEIAIQKYWPKTEAEYRSAAEIIDRTNALVELRGIEILRSNEILQQALLSPDLRDFVPNFVLATTQTPDENLKRVRSTADRDLLQGWFNQVKVYGDEPSEKELGKLSRTLGSNAITAVGNAASNLKAQPTAAERREQAKNDKNVDASVYLATTLLNRIGSPETAKIVGVSYEGYKQLQVLSKMSMKTAGAAVMTAGYVGIALMLADAFMSSSKGPSKEEQMMKAIQQMFEALQRSIKDLRKEMTTRFIGISNNQEQILNKLDTLSATITLSVNTQLTVIRRDIRQLQRSAQSMVDLYSDTEFRKYRTAVKEQLDNLRYAGVFGESDRQQEIEDAFRFLVEKTTAEYSSILWGMLYVGSNGSLEIWDSRRIISELRPENIGRVDLKVGLIPAIIKYFRPNTIVAEIPSPLEWATLVQYLIWASTRHPRMAKSIMKVEGNYLRELQKTALHIDTIFKVLLSRSTADAAKEKFKLLVSEICQIAITEPYDETILELDLRASGTVIDKTDESYAKAIRERRKELLPEFYPAAFSDTKIESLVQRDGVWGNGRLRITQNNALKVKAMPLAKGPVKRRNDKSYITQAAFVAARKELRLLDQVEDTVFLNKNYQRRMQKGTDYRGTHKILGNGKPMWSKFQNFSIHISGRFVAEFDPVKKAELYGLLHHTHPAEFRIKPLLENDVYTLPLGRKNRVKVGKTTIYAAAERKVVHKFASGLAKGTNFSLLETYLIAPKQPQKAFVSKNGAYRKANLANEDKSLALSEKHRRLPSKLSSFGSERRKIGNTRQLVTALKKELYLHHNNVSKAMMEDSKNLILGVPASDGSGGLSKDRFEAKRKKLQLKLDELQALASALRLMSGFGLIAKGIDPDVATGFARNDERLISSPQQFVALLDQAEMNAKVTMEENTLPLLLKEANARFVQFECLRSLELFIEDSLEGLVIEEGSSGAFKNLAGTLKGLEATLK